MTMKARYFLACEFYSLFILHRHNFPLLHHTI